MVSLSAAFLNLLCIVILNQLYERLALWLTNYERPRTQTEFEDNYTFKIFLFHTLNFYSSLIYMAFFKGKFYQNPAWRSENTWSLNNFQVDINDVVEFQDQIKKLTKKNESDITQTFHFYNNKLTHEIEKTNKQITKECNLNELKNYKITPLSDPEDNNGPKEKSKINYSELKF